MTRKLPEVPVRERHPFHALIGGVVDDLLDVRVLELQPDRLDLDQHLELAFNARREISERPADAELARHSTVLVVTEDLRQHVGNDHRRVGLIDVARARRRKNGLKTLPAGGQALGDTRGDGHDRESRAV